MEKNKKEMSDLTANMIAIGGIGAMLAIAGLPLIATVSIGTFTIGGLVGIAISKSKSKK